MTVLISVHIGRDAARGGGGRSGAGPRVNRRFLGRLAAGCRLFVHHQRRYGKRPVLRANGTRGFAELRLEPMSGEGCVFRKVTGDGGVVSPATNEHFHHSEDGTPCVYRAYEDIHRAMTTGSATHIEASEALRGLEIIMGIYESARLHRMLEFPITQESFPLESPR